jgi:pepF/M3 family oligoendopeptidase
MATSTTLPHWDMTVIFPSLQSHEFEQAFRSFVEDVGNLAARFEEHGIGRREPRPMDHATLQIFDGLVEQLNSVLARARTLGAYITAFVATDSRDDLAEAKRSEMQQPLVRLSQLDTRFSAWIGSLDLDALLERSDTARRHEFMLRKAKIDAEHQMSPAEEDLAAELNVTGGSAWGKLHSTLSSQIMVPIEVENEQREEPMTVIRNMAYDKNRDVRRRAYEAELAAWERTSVPIAAALNSIKGESNTVSEKRGWDSVLSAALFQNNIDRETLDAMLLAARESFPDWRRYLKAKARALRVEALPWYDLFAPVGRATSSWEYDAGRSFLLQQFNTYSPRLRDFVDRAYRDNWIDAEPRPGKRGGAFCMLLQKDESRVLSNYMPTYDGVSTLAHELGHAYHNFNLAERTPLQRDTPMVLAETASIFCETIIRHAALSRADVQEQIAILESSIQGSCQVVVDITSRFLFESAVLERRKQRELSVDELNNLMLDTQRETYGAGLDQNVLHPYMWAAKGHYYSTGRGFYNYPYMFGLLFGLGLYARYQSDPESFKTGYDELLSSTGLADVATLAQRFGIEIRKPDFWRSSLDILRKDIDQFEQLVASSADG